jgi:hypothetical protein
MLEGPGRAVQRRERGLWEGVHVPDGTPARINFEIVAAKTLVERYAELIGFTDALPQDMADNHDHELHGAPKNGEGLCEDLFLPGTLKYAGRPPPARRVVRGAFTGGGLEPEPCLFLTIPLGARYTQ